MSGRSATAAALLAALLAAVPVLADDDPRLALSRTLAARFQQELGGKLESASRTGGPAAAIVVCSEEAPRIAARLLQESGARVARISLKRRNAANAADDATRGTLQEFALRLMVGGDGPPERFTPAADGGARYLRAIVTQPQCLTCHGDPLAPDVAAALARHYPSDLGTGHSVGDLRGAFLIEWPAAGAGR